MKTMTIVLALGACTLFARDAQFTDAPYMNPRLSTEERMSDLISKMEMREKVAVLCTTAGFKMYEIRDGEVYVTKNLEHPYIDPEARAKEYGRPEDVIGCPANRAVVLALARKSMTLLENKGGALPLDPKTIRRIAVIGPNADKPENQLGDYTAPQQPGQQLRAGPCAHTERGRDSNLQSHPEGFRAGQGLRRGIRPGAPAPERRPA